MIDVREIQARIAQYKATGSREVPIPIDHAEAYVRLLMPRPAPTIPEQTPPPSRLYGRRIAG